MSLQNGFSAALVSAASIGVGASVGREGPIVHFGASLGSWIARVAQIPQGQVRRLLGCGVAAGIAASFNAPIAGAVFAIEVVVGKYTLHNFAPIALSTVIGTSVSRLYYGTDPAFIIPAHPVTSFAEIPVYALLGIVSAGIAILFLLCISATQAIFEKFRCPVPIRPAVAGLVVGSLAVFTPQILGVGYETTSAALNESLPLTLLMTLLVTKLLAAGISLGSGFGGGIFSPSIFLGAMSGGVCGTVWGSLFNSATGGYSAYTIVGMGAVAGAVLGAPLSTTLIVFEMTGDYPLTLAVLIGVIMSSILVNDVWGRTFFQWQLQQRGIDLTTGHAERLCMQLQMIDLMSTDMTILPATATTVEITAALQKGGPIYVRGEDGRTFSGAISFADLHKPENGQSAAGKLARMVPYLKQSDNLARAIAICNTHDAIAFPILSDTEEPDIVGFVTVKRIMNAYQSVLDRVAREEHSFTE